MQIGELRIERAERGIAVVALVGEHDLNTAPELRRALEGGLEADEDLVLDLSPATFVDSTILGIILEARRRTLEAGHGFAAAHDGSSPAVRRVLEITGLRSELPVHAELAEAVSAARSAGAGGTRRAGR